MIKGNLQQSRNNLYSLNFILMQKDAFCILQTTSILISYNVRETCITFNHLRKSQSVLEMSKRDLPQKYDYLSTVAC